MLKKKSLVFLTLCLVLLTACGKNTDTDTNTGDVTATSTTEEKPAAEVDTRTPEQKMLDAYAGVANIPGLAPSTILTLTRNEEANELNFGFDPSPKEGAEFEFFSVNVKPCPSESFCASYQSTEAFKSLYEFDRFTTEFGPVGLDGESVYYLVVLRGKDTPDPETNVQMYYVNNGFLITGNLIEGFALPNGTYDEAKTNEMKLKAFGFFEEVIKQAKAAK